jgi:ketosteroid isomerase-like protein
LEADNDHVIVPVDIEARTKVGKDLSGRALWMYRLRDRKIVRAELFVDTANTLDAIT